MKDISMPDVFAGMEEIVEKYGLKELAERAENIRLLAERDCVSVMFAGSDTAGMGLIINRLIGRELLPAAFEPLVEVSYGEKLEVTVTDSAGDTIVLEENSYDSLKSLDGGITEKVSIAAPAEGMLKNMKGWFCPLAGKAGEYANKFAELSDFYVIVVDAASLALEAERALVNHIHEKLCAKEQCYIVLNRIDVIPSRSTAVKAVSAAFSEAYAGELLLETDADLWEQWKPLQDKMLAGYFKNKPDRVYSQVKTLLGDITCSLSDKMEQQRHMAAGKKAGLDRVIKGKENYRLSCDNAQIDAKMILSLKIQDEFCTNIEAFGNAIKQGIGEEIRKIDNRDDMLGFLSPYINSLWASFSEYEFVRIKEEIRKNVGRIKEDLTQAFRETFDFELPELNHAAFTRVNEMLKNMEHNYSVVLEAATFDNLDFFINIFLFSGDFITAALLKLSKTLARFISEKRLLALNDKNIRQISQKIAEAIDEKLPEVITHYRETVFPLFVQDIQDIVRESIAKTFTCIDDNILAMKQEWEKTELVYEAIRNDIRKIEQLA